MIRNGAEVSEVHETTKKLTAYAQKDPLNIICKFEAELSINDGAQRLSTNSTFFVIKGGSQNLLGKDSATKLGVLFIGLPSSMKGNNTIREVSEGNVEMFPSIKGVELTIDIDQSITPIAQHARRVPIALKSQVEEEIHKLLRLGIIERVEGTSPWVSPLVIVIKDNGKLRLCVDMRRANTAIRRGFHLIPTLDDFLSRLSKAKMFSRLDIKDAYHQVMLSEKCRHITTFITHIGMFRYLRLMFGIICAPELFQMIIEQILSKCRNVLNYQDDILVWGNSTEDHDEALKAVLRTLKEKNVLLNNQKCEFGVPKTKFLGHLLSADGVRPTDEKIAAVKSFRTPATSEEIRSFLGLVGYVGRFIPDLATKTHSLRQLMTSKDTFNWEKSHDEAFDKLKDLVTSAPTLQYFNHERRTRLVVDASPVGLGAVLIQFDGETDDQPCVIAYAAKSLSPAEQRYCQTEREALAVVWGVERFSLFLLGIVFELETDHRPLEMIFKATSRPPGRIERWVLRLQMFNFKVVYRPGDLQDRLEYASYMNYFIILSGKQNIADPLSRLAVTMDKGDFDQSDDSLYINMVMESVAIDVHEIQDALKSDSELQQVVEAVVQNGWYDGDKKEVIKDYVAFRNDLSVIDGYLVKNCRLVIPSSLRPRMLSLAHEGHPGENAMISKLRDRVWWPYIDKDARNYVKRCRGCLLVSQPNAPEPMERRRMPTEPWVDLALDFLGPLPSGDYLLVLVDYCSRFKEVKVMKRITSEATINVLEPIFVNQGYPVTITLDNAKQFLSTEFENYCNERKITLNHTAPYWPQANGEVERQNRSLLKRLKISYALDRDWKKDLLTYLMSYNTTRHATTGKTPTEILRGKTIRSKIPSLGDIEHRLPPNTEENDRDAMAKYKGKEKEDAARRATKSGIDVGDKVLMKNLLPSNKLAPTFDNTEYSVVSVKVRDAATGKTYDRNPSHLKKLPETDQSSYEKTLSLPPAANLDLSSTTLQEPAPAATSTPIRPPTNSAQDEQQPQPAPRPIRNVQKPDWHKDFVVD